MTEPGLTTRLGPESVRAVMDNALVNDAPTWTPSPRELADLELLLLGAYAPLHGFLGTADVESVRDGGRLADGTPWPAPITLDVPDDVAAADRIVLQDPEGAPVAAVDITERVPSTAGTRVAGPVAALQPPQHGQFRRLRRTTAEVRAELPDAPVLGVVIRRPPNHRDLAEMRSAARRLDAYVLMLPLLAGAHPDAVVRSTMAVRREAADRGVAAVVPVPLAEHTAPAGDATPAGASQPAGRSHPPRQRLPPEPEMLLWAHVAASYGATHLLGDRAVDGAPIPVVVPPGVAYDMARDAWRPAEEIATDDRRTGPADDELAALLDAGEAIPEWFAPPAVAAELRAARPPRPQRGLTVFFTGLSGSGKSTVARGLHDALIERGGRTVTLLDGDVVRRLLSAGLTFSRADRDLNIRRIGYVAAEATRHGGLAICAPIAPYAATRAEVRQMVSAVGDFVLVHVATPLEVCESRDRKGLYAKARAGVIETFTGISDPYEEPDDADLVLDTSRLSVGEAVLQVLDTLVEGGWITQAEGPWTSG